MIDSAIVTTESNGRAWRKSALGRCDRTHFTVLDLLVGATAVGFAMTVQLVNLLRHSAELSARDETARRVE